MGNPRVSRLADFLERVLWTAIQSAAGATVVVLGSDKIDWRAGAAFVGVTTLGAVVKVLAGQNTGSDDTGAITPGGSAINPPPQS
jgi:hypothetical protein